MAAKPDPLEQAALAALQIVSDVAGEEGVPKAPQVKAVEPTPEKKPKRKQTALEQVAGQQQEILAEALQQTRQVMPHLLRALKKTRFRSGEAVASAIARIALAQAELAKQINAVPNNFEDTAALEAELLEAVGKLEGFETSP